MMSEWKVGHGFIAREAEKHFLVHEKIWGHKKACSWKSQLRTLQAYDRLRPAMWLDPDHKYDIGPFSAIGSAHFALISIQVFLNGLNDDIRALHIEGAPAFNNKTHQPVI